MRLAVGLPPAQVARIDTVFETLLRGLHGSTMTGGARLTVDHRFCDIQKVADAVLPFLLLKTGLVLFEDQGDWSSLVKLEVLAELRIKATQGEADKAMRLALDDLQQRVMRMRGLWVRADGEPVPFGRPALEAYGKGEIESLANRAGPTLRSGRPRIMADAGYALADLSIGLEFIADFDPSQYPEPGGERVERGIFRVGAVAVAPHPPGEPTGIPPGDPDVPFEFQSPLPLPERDTDRQTFYDEKREPLPEGAAFPPLTRSGRPPPRNTEQDPLRGLRVLPVSATLALAGTLQLEAIGYRVSGASAYITAEVETVWTSGNPAIAVVEAGLVTALDTGVVTITATRGALSDSSTLSVT